jgi:hypothetical protein
VTEYEDITESDWNNWDNGNLSDLDKSTVISIASYYEQKLDVCNRNLAKIVPHSAFVEEAKKRWIR